MGYVEVQESVEHVKAWLDEAEMTNEVGEAMETGERIELLVVGMIVSLCSHFIYTSLRSWQIAGALFVCLFVCLFFCLLPFFSSSLMYKTKNENKRAV